MMLLPAVAMAHHVLRDILPRAATVVDATVGNGRDTLFLAQNSPPYAAVVGFDIQEQALVATRRLLTVHGVSAKVRLVADSHAAMRRHLACPVDVVMFNLGYLPGGDHTVVTTGATTVAALSQAAALLRPGGVITVVAYSGHAGGAAETAQVEAFLAGLGQHEFTVIRYGAVNQANHPPVLYAVEKIRCEEASHEISAAQQDQGDRGAAGNSDSG